MVHCFHVRLDTHYVQMLLMLNCQEIFDILHRVKLVTMNLFVSARKQEESRKFPLIVWFGSVFTGYWWCPKWPTCPEWHPEIAPPSGHRNNSLDWMSPDVISDLVYITSRCCWCSNCKGICDILHRVKLPKTMNFYLVMPTGMLRHKFSMHRFV